MGKSHENLIDVQKMLAKYADYNEPVVTVSGLHQYMELDYDLSERTVRRCLKVLCDQGIIEEKEIGNTTCYVVYPELLPNPETSDLYSAGDQFW